MKSASANMQTHLQQSLTKLATCWFVERVDGTQYAFTDHDRDLVVTFFSGTETKLNQTYKASTGYQRSAMEDTATLSVDNLEISSFFDAADIAREDILLGKFSYAEVYIFLVNWSNLTHGPVRMKRGRVGDITVKDEQLIIEQRGLKQAYMQQLLEVYTPDCRADLGDARCKVDLLTGDPSFHILGNFILPTPPPTTTTFTVLIAGTAAADDWKGGLVVFKTGIMAPRAFEIRTFIGGEVTLAFPMPTAPAGADTVDMFVGCPKTVEACRDRFANIVNFRGEPYVPGQDAIFKTTASFRQGG